MLEGVKMFFDGLFPETPPFRQGVDEAGRVYRLYYSKRGGILRISGARVDSAINTACVMTDGQPPRHYRWVGRDWMELKVPGRSAVFVVGQIRPECKL